MTPLSFVAPSPAPARAAGAAAAPHAPGDAGAFEALLAEASPIPEGRGRGGSRGRVERDPDAAPVDGAAAPDPSSIVTLPVVALPAPPVEPEPVAPAPAVEPEYLTADLQAETGEPVPLTATDVRTAEATAAGPATAGDPAGFRRQTDGPLPPAPASEPAAQATSATRSDAGDESSPVAPGASAPTAVEVSGEFVDAAASREGALAEFSTASDGEAKAAGPHGPDPSRRTIADRAVGERPERVAAETPGAVPADPRSAGERSAEVRQDVRPDAPADATRAPRDAAREALRAAIARGMPDNAGHGAEVRQGRLEEAAAHVPGREVVAEPPNGDAPADAPPVASAAVTQAPPAVRGRGAEPRTDAAQPVVDSGAPAMAATPARQSGAGFDPDRGAGHRDLPRGNGLPAAASTAGTAMPAFAGHLERAASTASMSPAGAPYAGPAADAPAAGPQIVKSLHLLASARGGEARLRLEPEHLGSVTVLMKVEGDRVVATLRAETAAVRGWIAAHQDMLRDQLADLGLRLEELVVTEDPRDTPEDRPEQQQEKPQPQPRRPLQRHREDAPRFEVIV